MNPPEKLTLLPPHLVIVRSTVWWVGMHISLFASRCLNSPEGARFGTGVSQGAHPHVRTLPMVWGPEVHKSTHGSTAGISLSPLNQLARNRDPFVPALEKALKLALFHSWFQSVHLCKAWLIKIQRHLNKKPIARLWTRHCQPRGRFSGDVDVYLSRTDSRQEQSCT